MGLEGEGPRPADPNRRGSEIEPLDPDIGAKAVNEDDVRRVVQEVADDLLRDGRADLAADRHEIELRPRNGAACRVGVAIQGEREVSLWLGRYGTVVDVYDRDAESLLARLRELLRAIIEGRYDEEVRLSEESGEVVPGEARGVFHLRDGDRTYKYSYVPSIGSRSRWQRLTYEPY